MKEESNSFSFTEKLIAGGIILVFIFQCLALILILPPYEGFDETGHYSYISVLKDKHLIPDFRYTPLDATVEEDREGLPRPYGRKPPFEENEGINYSEFFNEVPIEERNESVRKFWELPEKAVSYKPGQDINWEGQHPPLYYLIMVIPYQVARGWSPGMRILFLRFFSILIACGSLVFWYKSVRLPQSKTTRQVILLGGLVILFFPSLVFDLSRIGNDSLAVFIFSGVFYFLLSSYKSRQNQLTDFVKLSVALGFGLITKMFFLPVMLGVILYTLWLGIKVNKIGTKALILRLSLLVIVPLIISGWWFVLFYKRYGMLFGSAELYMFRQISNPLGDELTFLQFLMQMLRIQAAFIATFLWSGTWSWVHRPLWYYALFAPIFILLIGNLLKVRKFKTERRQILIASTILLVPILLGFAYHMYQRVRFTGVGSGTGGYYLFFAWPILAVLFSVVFETEENITSKILTLIGFGMVLFFEISGWWFSTLIYSGIVVKMGSIKTGIGLIPLNIANFSIVVNRLRQITFPCWSVIFFVVSYAVKIILVILVIFTA